ncbi:hypothetical protein [Klebsiella aerogenes EA1509E]|nr:hypothetical protein [Klebsiella aerogenes EA1509E]
MSSPLTSIDHELVKNKRKILQVSNKTVTALCLEKSHTYARHFKGETF